MNKKLKLDIIGIIGIIIMIVAGIYVYYESNICHSPLKTLTAQILERETNLNYTFVVIEFYDGNVDNYAISPHSTYRMDYSGKFYRTTPPLKYQEPNYQEINLSNLAK